MTKHHRWLRTIVICCLKILEVESLESRCVGKVMFPLESAGEGPSWLLATYLLKCGEDWSDLTCRHVTVTLHLRMTLSSASVYLPVCANFLFL